MTGAQVLMRPLTREGVEVIFGLPGVQFMSVYDALYSGPGIRLTRVRHKQSPPSWPMDTRAPNVETPG